MLATAVLCLALPGIVGAMPCRIDGFPVQQNFDLNKYLGKWYIWERFVPGSTDAEDAFQNHQHTYIQDGMGDADVFVRGRNPAGQCQYQNKKLHLHGATPAKLHYHVHGTMPRDDYWVISTDYENYAVVYGCLNVAQNGKCLQAYSYVLVRSGLGGVPGEANTTVDAAILSVCLDRQNFEKVPRTESECRQCDMDTWTVQPAFDLQQFLGVWHEILFRPREPFPAYLAYTEYNHTYSLKPNGTVQGDVRGRDPTTGEYFSFPDNLNLGTTPVAGKLMIIKPTSEPDDYWVIETDYTGYAFVQGCARNPDSPPGTCIGIRSWVWARQKYIDSFQFVRLLKLFRQYCIDEDKYFITEQIP